MESKYLRVNIGKTKAMISRLDVGLVRERGKWPCAVCKKGVGSNAIRCTVCNKWVNKICSGV